MTSEFALAAGILFLAVSILFLAAFAAFAAGRASALSERLVVAVDFDPTDVGPYSIEDAPRLDLGRSPEPVPCQIIPIRTLDEIPARSAEGRKADGEGAA